MDSDLNDSATTFREVSGSERTGVHNQGSSTAAVRKKADSDSEGDESDTIFHHKKRGKGFARSGVKKERNLERTPLLSGRNQRLSSTGATENASDNLGCSTSSDEEDNAIFSFEKYGSFGGEEFRNVLIEAARAIHKGVFPERIRQGSSGSYFVFNCNREKIGVFKPKNEEPYGQLNPKWVKWIHRIFFPCCFGRSCLLPNQVGEPLFIVTGWFANFFSSFLNFYFYF